MYEINVKKLTASEMALLDLSSYAALACYNPELPEMGKNIDVKKRLFETGHHTTLQHKYYTFAIDGLAVGDVTFGLHLASSFYNTDQRSGRFCIDMFKKPDYSNFESYIRTFWPEIEDVVVHEILEYIRYGIDVFNEYQPAAAKVAEKLMQAERPFFPPKNLVSNAEKIANEQLRNFIPIIFPTGLVFTVNFSALVAFWQSAWTPVMKDVLDRMVHEVVLTEPELQDYFQPEDRISQDWSVPMSTTPTQIISTSPTFVLDTNNPLPDWIYVPDKKWQHPVDKLQFRPECMDNDVYQVKGTVNLSVATMGQDQRHRTIKRSSPLFSGSFYLAPILQELKLHKQAEVLMKKWSQFFGRHHNVVPSTLIMNLAPYGAEVQYTKSAPINALIHESSKRLCWCAQEEIYNLALGMREGLLQQLGEHHELIKMLNPPCYADGKCLEGPRYCGRDNSLRTQPDKYFVLRKV